MRERSAMIDSRVLEEAADWLTRLHADDVSGADREACARWRQTSAMHDRAWARAELLLNKLGGLPAQLALPTLDRDVDHARRAILARLGLLAAAAPAGWLSWRAGRQQDWWWGDHRTVAGEQRDITLADGTRITLNTASAVDVRFDRAERLIVLRDGEVLVRSSPDTAIPPRPLRVQTAQGRMQALGTVFNVREESQQTQLTVLEGAVRVEPVVSGAAAQIIQAGQQVNFDRQRIAQPLRAGEEAIAWTRGMLLADNQRLAAFVEQLARYRNGVVRCDPLVADLRISGAFPLRDTDQALRMLANTYPVAVKDRLGGYWVSVTAPK